jgi:hypothetical protein
MLSKDSSIFHNVEKAHEYIPLHKKNASSDKLILFSNNLSYSSFPPKTNNLEHGFIIDCELQYDSFSYVLVRTAYKKHGVFYIYQANRKIVGISDTLEQAKNMITQEIKSIIDFQCN